MAIKPKRKIGEKGERFQADRTGVLQKIMQKPTQDGSATVRKTKEVRSARGRG